jgi:hypothetical protein
MTFVEVMKNEYVTNDGPKIEIVLGSDIAKQTVFAERPYYIPAPPHTNTATGDDFSEMILTPKKKPQTPIQSGTTTNLPNIPPLPTTESSVSPDSALPTTSPPATTPSVQA